LGPFVGNNNVSVLASLRRYADEFEEKIILPPVLVLYGPPGSGKSSIAVGYFKYLCDIMGIESSKTNRCLLMADIKLKEHDLWHRISQFSEEEENNKNQQKQRVTIISSKFKLVLLDNIDHATPSHQQELKNIMIQTAGKLRYLFVCEKPGDLIGFIRGQATYLKTAQIKEKDALTVILTMCAKLKIGYDREGIQEVFKSNPNVKQPQIPSILLY